MSKKSSPTNGLDVKIALIKAAASVVVAALAAIATTTAAACRAFPWQ